jgi:uncharacterized phiE125 gp8 family phage protein
MADLVTLTEYKAYAGILSPAQDTILKSLIPKVSEVIKTVCKSRLIDYVDDPYTQIYSGGAELILLEAPVIAVLSVEKSADYGNTYTELVEYTDYVFDIESQSVKPISLETYPSFTRMPNGYRVTYNAGYTELPADLKLAVFDTISFYLKNDSAVHSDKSPGTNGSKVEFVTSSKLPSAIQRTLNAYTAHWL